MYKTGDLARFLGSGDIEYRGRIDFQVKIRGLRIELGEIENVIRDFPGVHQAVVVAREDVPGEKRLAAYLVPKDTDNFRTRELRDFLKSKLPDYMVPAAIVSLPVLPLTSVGKVDRRALPAPSYDNLAGAREYTPPRTQTERLMSQIWSKFLGVEKVGTRENFFDLGGDSLLALMMFAQISKEFGNTLSLNSLFDTPTIEQLSLVIDAGRAQGPKYRLVAIRAEGTRPPLFWVPGGIGSVLAFRRVSVLLGPDQPVYGLEFRLPENGETFDEIEVRAAPFCRADARLAAHRTLLHRGLLLRRTGGLRDGPTVSRAGAASGIPCAGRRDAGENSRRAVERNCLPRPTFCLAGAKSNQTRSRWIIPMARGTRAIRRSNRSQSPRRRSRSGRGFGFR